MNEPTHTPYVLKRHNRKNKIIFGFRDKDYQPLRGMDHTNTTCKIQTGVEDAVDIVLEGWDAKDGIREHKYGGFAPVSATLPGVYVFCISDEWLNYESFSIMFKNEHMYPHIFQIVTVRLSPSVTRYGETTVKEP